MLADALVDGEPTVLTFTLLEITGEALRAGELDGETVRIGDGLLETVDDVDSDVLAVTLVLDVKLGEPDSDGDVLVDAESRVESVPRVEPDGDAVALFDGAGDSVALSDVVVQYDTVKVHDSPDAEGSGVPETVSVIDFVRMSMESVSDGDVESEGTLTLLTDGLPETDGVSETTVVTVRVDAVDGDPDTVGDISGRIESVIVALTVALGDDICVDEPCTDTLGCTEAEKAEDLEPLVVTDTDVRGVSDDDGVTADDKETAIAVTEGQRETDGELLEDRLKREDCDSRSLDVDDGVTEVLAETDREPVGDVDGDVDSEATAFEGVSIKVETGVDEAEDVVDADTLPETDVDALTQIETVCVGEGDADRQAEPVTDSVPVADPGGEVDFAADTEGATLAEAQFVEVALRDEEGVVRVDALDDPLMLAPPVGETDVVPPTGDAEVLPVSDGEPELLVEARALELPPAIVGEGLLVADALNDAAAEFEDMGGAVSVAVDAREGDRSAVDDTEKVSPTVELEVRVSCTVAVLPIDVVGVPLLDTQRVEDEEIDAVTDMLRDERGDADAHGVTELVRDGAAETDCAGVVESRGDEVPI